MADFANTHNRPPRLPRESVVDRVFAEGLGGRLLPFGSAAAHEFAHIAASRPRAGQPIFRSRRAHRRMIQKESETGGTSLKAEWLTGTEPSIGLRAENSDPNSSQ
jgi:hypothetical protein